MTTMAEPTMTAARISSRESLPSPALSSRAFSRSPGMVAFSGLHTIMKKPQSRKIISQPTGNM